MKTRIILAVATILILSISLSMFSSNMAFKLIIPLTANQDKYISLPYRSSYTTAELLRNRLIFEGGGDVRVYNWNGKVWEMWAGGKEDVNFNITPGLGIKVVTSNNVTSWQVVGSHDGHVQISFKANEIKYVSVPYHSKSTTAAQLRNEIMAAAGYSTPYPIGIVDVYMWSGGYWRWWSGGGIFGLDNFQMEPGTAYKIRSTVEIAGWEPAHY